MKILVLLILAHALIWYLPLHTQAPEVQHLLPEDFLTEVDHIEYQSKDFGWSLTKTNQWQLDQASEGDINQALVANLMVSLSNYKIETVTCQKKNFDLYGIDASHGQLLLKTRSKQSLQVIFGEPYLSEFKLFLRLRDCVYLGSKHISIALNRKVTDFKVSPSESQNLIPMGNLHNSQ